MPQSRLGQQGFVNLHRKLLFGILASGLVVYLAFAPDIHPLPGIALTASWICGSVLVFLGILGRVFATISIGGHKDRAIMKTEIYSICRNPLYFSSFLMALGIGALSGRADFLVITAAGYLAIFYPMMHTEANYLRERFEDFAEYERRVPLFFPKFSLWQERKNFEINFKLVRRTLMDALVALPVIPLMILVHFARHVWLPTGWHW